MRIFYDVDTQNDFMNKDGALYVHNAELIKPNLRKLTLYAVNHNIRILGSADRHFGTDKWKEYELELKKWDGPFPDHCMNLTEGEMKIPETFTNAIFIPNIPPDEKLIPYTQEELEDIITSSKNIFFEKQGYSVFPTEDCPGGNEFIDAFLRHLGVTDAVVYGVATDYCVKTAVIGMRKRGINTHVVYDAIEAVNVNPDDGKKALEEMVGAGATLKTTDDILK